MEATTLKTLRNRLTNIKLNVITIEKLNVIPKESKMKRQILLMEHKKCVQQPTLFFSLNAKSMGEKSTYMLWWLYKEGDQRQSMALIISNQTGDHI